MVDKIYRPYRSGIWFAPFSFGIGLLACVVAGSFLPSINITFFAILGAGILSFGVSKVSYDTANIAVFFEQEGIRIAGGRYKDYFHGVWTDFPYAYHALYRGHRYLLLSACTLSQQKIHLLTKQSAFLSKICVSSAVVIYLDVLQDTSLLEEIIRRNVSYIDSY